MDDDLGLTGRSKNIFSKGKWEAEDMLVDHESGTDNMVDKSQRQMMRTEQV